MKEFHSSLASARVYEKVAELWLRTLPGFDDIIPIDTANLRRTLPGTDIKLIKSSGVVIYTDVKSCDYNDIIWAEPEGWLDNEKHLTHKYIYVWINPDNTKAKITTINREDLRQFYYDNKDKYKTKKVRSYNNQTKDTWENFSVDIPIKDITVPFQEYEFNLTEYADQLDLDRTVQISVENT